MINNPDRDREREIERSLAHVCASVSVCLCVCVRFSDLGFGVHLCQLCLQHRPCGSSQLRHLFLYFLFFFIGLGSNFVAPRTANRAFSLSLSLSLSLSSCWAPCVNSCASRVTQGCTHTGNRHSRARTRAHTHTSGSWNDFALATIFSKNSGDRRGRV